MKLNERTNRRNNHGRYTKAEMIEGKTMLKAALRVIKEHENAGNPLLPDAGLIPLSAAGAMTAPRLRRKNLKAIVVTRRNGGWIADLVLNNAPGMGDVIGTPDELRGIAFGRDGQIGDACVLPRTLKNPEAFSREVLLTVSRLS